MSDEMSSDEILNYLDWEIDEGWTPLYDSTTPPSSNWGKVTMFQIVPGSLSIHAEEAPVEPDNSLRNTLIVMVTLAVPFWLLAGYGLYRLVAG